MAILDPKQDDFNSNINNVRLRFCFSPIYKKKFVQLKEELNLGNRELLYYLIDYASMEEANNLCLFRKKLNKRLNKGVGLDYIIQLKLIYTVIGIFLKKINYL